MREAAYLVRSGLFNNEAIPVDVLISPEQVVTNYIKRLIEHPGSLQVIDFAGGKAQLVAVRAYYGGPLVGQELRQLRRHMPNVDTRVAAIFRRNHAILPQGDTVIEADDEVFFIAARGHPCRDERDAPARRELQAHRHRRWRAHRRAAGRGHREPLPSRSSR